MMEQRKKEWEFVAKQDLRRLNGQDLKIFAPLYVSLTTASTGPERVTQEDRSVLLRLDNKVDAIRSKQGTSVKAFSFLEFHHHCVARLFRRNGYRSF
jgi:hypothetical protein